MKFPPALVAVSAWNFLCRQADKLSFTLFTKLVSDPHTVRKTNLYEEILESYTFSPPRPDIENNAFLHNVFTTNDSLLCNMYTSISFSLEFDKMIFDIVFDPFSSIFSFFFSEFVSSLHSYFSSYHSQTFAVAKHRLDLSFLVHILQIFLSKKLKNS